MLNLTTLAQFQELWNGHDDRGNPGPKRFVIWFSAAWCGPCQKMDKKALEAAVHEMSVPLYYCDHVVNPEAADHYGITQFPTFVMFNPKVEVARRISGDTGKVCQWIRKVGLTQ